jgi:ribosome recycling factor
VRISGGREIREISVILGFGVWVCSCWRAEEESLSSSERRLREPREISTNLTSHQQQNDEMPPPLSLRAHALKQLFQRPTLPITRAMCVSPISHSQLNSESTTNFPSPVALAISPFSTTPTLSKKKKERPEFAAKLATKLSSQGDSKKEKGSIQALVDDPFDHTTLEAGIQNAIEKLNGELSKLRTGGRFNPELIEAVRVRLGEDGSGSERLGDLAQVLPKGGRQIQILVGEKDV